MARRVAFEGRLGEVWDGAVEPARFKWKLAKRLAFAVSATLLCGDALEVLKTLPAESVQCCVTSPPYWGLRDYGVAGQLGLEATPDEYVATMVAVFLEVQRVLQDDGTLWLNIGDSYSNSRCGPQGASGQMANRSVVAARVRERNETRRVTGVPAKNLVGIP